MSVPDAIETLRDAIDRLNRPIPPAPDGRDYTLHYMAEYAQRAGYALGAMQSAIYELAGAPSSGPL